MGTAYFGQMMYRVNGENLVVRAGKPAIVYLTGMGSAVDVGWVEGRLRSISNGKTQQQPFSRTNVACDVPTLLPNTVLAVSVYYA